VNSVGGWRFRRHQVEWSWSAAKLAQGSMSFRESKQSRVWSRSTVDNEAERGVGRKGIWISLDYTDVRGDSPGKSGA
jgi:hypothetical protein